MLLLSGLAFGHNSRIPDETHVHMKTQTPTGSPFKSVVEKHTADHVVVAGGTAPYSRWSGNVPWSEAADRLTALNDKSIT